AGIYAVAIRAAELLTFVLAAVNTVIAPRVASYYYQGDSVRLQRLLSASARRALLLTLPLGLMLIIAGPWLLNTVFGAEYAPGAIAMAILAGAQLVNVAAGSVGLVLNMTGHERITAWGVGLAAILNIALNALLIPLWGIEGAAIATASSLVAWNLILWLAVRRHLGLRPSALGI
ncbi:MAG: polysaccharide biosynthesis C-terminal domain-containing protein, partial [Alphaproteobacteria bacterium]